MRFWSTIIAALSLATSSFAWQDSTDGLTPYSIYAYGINASFIGYGARITHLYIHDKENNPIDVVVGYDDPAMYIYDNAHNRTFFGAVVGRYANRIKNGTFEIDGETFHIPENEHDGRDTLHGGFIGYDNRNWTMTSHNTSSITFTLYDDAGTSGFPGTVINHVTFTVEGSYNGSPARLISRIVSIPLDHATPIMLANHIYWNLNAFSTATVLNDTLALPYSDRTIDIDSLEVPTGGFTSVKYPWQDPPVPLNFTSPKQIYEGALYSQQCGAGCTGIDNAYIIDRPTYEWSESMASPQIMYTGSESGITLTLYTNQGSLQVYSCNGQNGTIANKASQQGDGVTTVDKYGCIVFETQQPIDGINNPQWGERVLEREIYSSITPPAVNMQIYEFTTSS